MIPILSMPEGGKAAGVPCLRRESPGGGYFMLLAILPIHAVKVLTSTCPSQISSTLAARPLSFVLERSPKQFKMKKERPSNPL